MSNYQIGIGKTLDLNTSKRVRMNFSIGLGYTTINEPENWTPRNTTRVVENYSWNYRKYSTASIIINPKIELLESFYDVVTISPMLIINKDRTYIGTGMGRTLGF